MKKISFFVSGILLLQLANAQVQKGSIFTGGSFGVNSASTKTNYNNDQMSGLNWTIAPQIGKAIQVNKIIGIEFLVGGTTNKTTNSVGVVSKSSGNQYGAGVFYRQYFPVYKKWMMYGQANAGVNLSNTTQTTSGIKFSSANTLGINIAASFGITYQVSKKLWLEAGLSNLVAVAYNHQKSDNYTTAGVFNSSFTTDNVAANFNLSGSNSFAFGFRWILPAKG